MNLPLNSSNLGGLLFTKLSVDGCFNRSVIIERDQDEQTLQPFADLFDRRQQDHRFPDHTPQ